MVARANDASVQELARIGGELHCAHAQYSATYRLRSFGAHGGTRTRGEVHQYGASTYRYGVSAITYPGTFPYGPGGPSRGLHSLTPAPFVRACVACVRGASLGCLVQGRLADDSELQREVEKSLRAQRDRRAM